MIKFAICDDDIKAIENVEELLLKCAEGNFDIKIEKFSSSEELKQKIEAGERFDIFMLDVVMPELDGIDLGKVVKEKLPNAKIIYLSASSEFAVMSYDVHAFYYLLKPVKEDTFKKVLSKAVESVDSESKKEINVQVKAVEGDIVVSMSDIKYCILENRRIRYAMQEGDLMSKTIRSNFPDSIKEFLDSGMFSFSASYIAINLRKVLRIDASCVFLTSGEKFALSRTYATKFKKDYFDYYFNIMKGEND